jgi:hypothetical protein
MTIPFVLWVLELMNSSDPEDRLWGWGIFIFFVGLGVLCVFLLWWLND